MRRVERRLVELAGEGLPVSAAVRRLVGEGFTAWEVLRALEGLEGSGRVVLVESAPGGVAGFLFSPRCMGFWLVAAVSFSTLVLVGLGVSVFPWVLLRYVFGSVFVLFVPGFSLLQLLYFRREDLGDLERFALSLGLSLALVPLVGLALNYTPWGIRLYPVSVSLAALSLSLVSAACVRRYLWLRGVAG